MQHDNNRVLILATAEDHIDSFHKVLDSVARERKYLTMLEAFPLEETRQFTLDMIRDGNPHFVAVLDNEVIGWCDIRRHFFPSHAHRGALGMGLAADYRGLGLGSRLIAAALNHARAARFVRIELSVNSDNQRAIKLYEKFGFVAEGVQRRSVLIDGRFNDSVNMALMLDEQ